MGELSKALEKAERTRTDLHPNAGKQTKTQQLSDVGIPNGGKPKSEQLSDARQAHNTEMEVQVAEIKLRALRRMGELSKALEKAQTGRRSVTGLISYSSPTSAICLR